MKKTNLLWIAALVMAGCSSQTESLPQPRQAEIGFETFVKKSKTRVDIDMNNVHQFPMAIWGAKTSVADATQSTLYVNTPFSYDAANNRWAANEALTYFWEDGYVYDFLALIPADAAKQAYIDGNITVIPGVPVVSPVATGKDLMVAGAAGCTKGANSMQPVQLSFSHMLSRLSIYLYGVNDDNENEPRINVNSLAINLPGRDSDVATFRQGEYGESFTGTWTWPADVPLVARTLTVNASAALNLAPSTATTDQLLATATKLPQEYFLAPSPEEAGPAPTVTVSYQINGEPYTKTAAVTGITRFKQGVHVRLFIGINSPESEEFIEFKSVEVDEWDVENVY